MALAKRLGRTTIKDVHDDFVAWMQEEKGVSSSREDVLEY